MTANSTNRSFFLAVALIALGLLLAYCASGGLK